MGNKILVTGPTGKVGSQLVKQLVAKGEAVKAAAHHPASAQAMGWQGVEIVPFDYGNAEEVEAALAEVDRLFLVLPLGQPNALENELAVIDAAKAHGVKHIIQLSAAGVEGNDASPLRIAEKYIEASGIAYTHVRPSWFNQNFSTTEVASIKEGAIYLPADDGKISFIDTRDIAAVAVAAFTEPGHTNKAYVVTGSEALDHHQVTDLLSQAIGKTIKYVPISDEQFRTTLSSYGAPAEVIELLSGLYGMVRQGWTSGVTNTVAEVVGRPAISFAQFARDYAEVWK
jgi:uncharacterized protein YbjT (DUF2867 family)